MLLLYDFNMKLIILELTMIINVLQSVYCNVYTADLSYPIYAHSTVEADLQK